MKKQTSELDKLSDAFSKASIRLHATEQEWISYDVPDEDLAIAQTVKSKAREQITKHVTEAMLAALEMGKRVGCSDGVGPFCTDSRRLKWEALVRYWTT